VTASFKNLGPVDLLMDLPQPLWTRLDESEPEAMIHELEDSRLYRPDREYEGRHFETIYGLDTRPSGKWKYDHIIGPHSILYDPEDDAFDVRRTDMTTYLKDGLERLAGGLRDRIQDERETGTERYGFLLEDDDIDAYEAFLEDDERFVRERDDGVAVYRSDEATVRMEEGRSPDRERRYADVDVEIPVGESVPGASLLVDGQRKVAFDADLEAEAVYVEDLEMEGLAER
jgi:hypothetical protein